MSLAYSVCGGDLCRRTKLCASLSKWNVTTICQHQFIVLKSYMICSNNDRTQIGSPSVFTNLCLFSSLPPSLLCLLCSFPHFSSFCLFSPLTFSRPYTSLTEVSVCKRRGWFAQQCRNENFFCSQSISYFTKFLLTKVHIPRKGPCPVDSVHSLRGLGLSFCARFMKVCRFWNIFKIAVELKSSYFGQVPSPVWLTRSRTFCLTPEGCWRIIIDNAIKSKN